MRAIVLTQSHPDHTGGWSVFADPGVMTIAHERMPETIAERRRIAPYLSRRSTARLFDRRALQSEPQLEGAVPLS
jgi:glyoxylase-like metal-dependent hydrolase (beta-lactamase superfamily II)